MRRCVRGSAWCGAVRGVAAEGFGENRRDLDELFLLFGTETADLVLDHSGDVPAQLSAVGTPHVDMVLSTAASTDHLNWIPDILRPFGHLSVVDGIPTLDAGALAAKSLTLHTEMVFSRIIHGASPEAQGRTLATVAELAESGRTIGKVVIAT